MKDSFTLGGREFHSRFILGSGKYDLKLIKAAVEQGGAEIITIFPKQVTLALKLKALCL